jgi:hypothetical protein
LRDPASAWETGPIVEETRTAAGKAARRRLAVQKAEAGWSQKDVADFLGVHPVTVNKGVRASRADPAAGLTGKPHPGRTPFLTPPGRGRCSGGWPRSRPGTGSRPTCGPPAGWPT